VGNVRVSEVKRVVSTGFWTDKKVLNDFSPEDKYFMLYLLTNPYTTQLGIYNFPIKHVALDIGYSEDTVRVLLDRFENKYGIIKYSNTTSEIAIKNYLRHSIVKGGKPVYDCLIKEEKNVIDKSLLKYVYENINSYDHNTINKTVLDYINNIYINDNDNDESSTNRGTNRSNEPFTPIDLESKWLELVDIYPKKTGLSVAKVVWMKFVSSILIDNQSDVANDILAAAEYYKEWYSHNNNDDVNFNYIPKLENWLKDIDYWLMQVGKKEIEVTREPEKGGRQ